MTLDGSAERDSVEKKSSDCAGSTDASRAIEVEAPGIAACGFAEVEISVVGYGVRDLVRPATSRTEVVWRRSWRSARPDRTTN